MIRAAILIFVMALAGPVAAEDLAATLFEARQNPSSQDPMPVGTYARGCGAGLVELPETGPSWQAMRVSRNRNYGHPVMIDYLIGLSQVARKVGWAGLYIGDISQPRGGPSPSGHASHQTGLDADIWYLPPARINLSLQSREDISANSVRSADQKRVNENWTRAHAVLLQAAASDPRVERIFVAAAIKLELCKTARPADKKWLQRLRPIAGHHDHFHVRLKCPKGASQCEPQTPTVSELSKGGNGCDETLDYWVSEAYLNPPKPTKPAEPVPHVKRPREFTMDDLPQQCANVLASD